MPTKKGQVWSQASKTTNFDSSFYCWNPESVLKSSKIMDTLDAVPALQPFRDTGTPKFSIYSVNAYGTAAKSSGHYVQKFHRDFDGYLCLAMMILLSDVTEDNGATEVTIKDGKGRAKNIFMEGKKGDVYLFDTFLQHRANLSFKTDRKLIWIRFGETPNAAQVQNSEWSTYQFFNP